MCTKSLSGAVNVKQLPDGDKFTEFWPGDRYGDLWPFHYKAGMWMWLFHRITGLFIIGYGVIHLAETALASLPGTGEATFDWFYRVVGLHPLIQVLDVILVAALVYHGFNGLRLTLIDLLGFGVRSHRRLFWLLMAGGMIVWLLAVIEIWPYIFSHSG